MEFKLTRTSVRAFFIRSVQEARNYILGVDQRTIGDQYKIRFRADPSDGSIGMTIEINTPEELVYLQVIIGIPLIIRNHIIEIYDDYRE